MAAPDFALHRRRLRRLRIAEALSLDVEVTSRRRSRDILLELLAQELNTVESAPSLTFGSVDDTNIDLAVSMALADFPEPYADALFVTLMSASLLAADGQFARLQQLNSRFNAIAAQIETDRPFLAAQVMAYSQILKGSPGSALRTLRTALGIEGSQRPNPVERSAENLSDLLAAAVLHRWLGGSTAMPALPLDAVRTRSIAENHEALFTAARVAALNSADGLLLTNLDFLDSYARAAALANPMAIVGAANQSFTEPRLAEYLAGRGVRTLFPAQIHSIEQGALDPEDRLIALPTSSGKTFLAELRIAAELNRSPGGKAVYIAPYRLLARQVERSLSRGLKPLGLRVADIGSGFDTVLERAPSALDGLLSEDDRAGLPDVAVATPERLDALSRLADSDRAGSQVAREFFEELTVVVFDEIQLIGRPGRGHRFELLLTRLRDRYPHVALLGLSAATHGTDDLASWISAPPSITAGRRPTGTLELLWRTNGTISQRAGHTSSKVAELPRTANAGNDAAGLVLRFGSEYWPVLVIEPTRPMAESLAAKLRSRGPAEGQQWRDDLTDPQRDRISRVAAEVHAVLGDAHPLAELVSHGIAYHHAGVPSHLLRLFEELAEDRLLRALVATTTVAEGADLPFRVVVIPHLNFQGATRKLERDLYLNIIGRAGRANVAVEGMVFILDSDANTLRRVVRNSLWNDTQGNPVTSVLPHISSRPDSLEKYTALRDVESQILAWLGGGGTSLQRTGPGDDGEIRDTGEQVEEMVRRTFAAAGTRRSLPDVAALFTDALRDLENNGLVQAASPYQLTAAGDRARLTGLSTVSCGRLQRAAHSPNAAELWELADARDLSPSNAEQLARIVMESEEALLQSVWFKRSIAEADRLRVVLELASGQRAWPYGEADFELDVALLSGWISGQSFADLARLAPNYPRGLFKGTDPHKRSSDASEQIGRIVYPASWVFGGLRHLSANGDNLPTWIRSAIESGVPSRTACLLVRELGLTRSGAVSITRVLPESWYPDAASVLSGLSDSDLRDTELTALDRERITRTRSRS